MLFYIYFQVHNWTVEQTSEWLATSVELPQYIPNFIQHRVTGATLPRLVAIFYFLKQIFLMQLYFFFNWKVMVTYSPPPVCLAATAPLYVCLHSQQLSLVPCLEFCLMWHSWFDIVVDWVGSMSIEQTWAHITSGVFN